MQSKKPLTTEFYDTVKSQIVSLQLLPGQILMVQPLAAEHGISRTPVKEALVRLKEEGLLTAADGRKFRVSEITWKLVHDIYEARKALEVIAVVNAVNTMNDKQVNSLRELYGLMQASYDREDYPGYVEADMRFHSLLTQHLDNNVITSWMDHISDQQQRIRYLTRGVGARMEKSLGEHEYILKSIQARDASAASEAMTHHLDRALADVLNQRETLYPSPIALIKD